MMTDNLQQQIGIVDEKNAAPITETSVVDTPKVEEHQHPISSMILRFATIADQITPWGTYLKRRDSELREFWTTESFLASAVYSTSIRNASFQWEIKNTNEDQPPHKNTIAAATKMLKNADRGAGWATLIIKTCGDIYTQDNGAFWELVRAEPGNPTSPVVNVAHLDSYRCDRTGDPEYPVIYSDRRGREHKLAWYEVVTISEFPSPVETMYGAQVCAVSRALRAAQIARDISIYKQEKIGGRHQGAMHVVGGVGKTELEDALALHDENLTNRGLVRYSSPLVLAGLDPDRTVSHVQIDLASLPDGFDEQTTLTWYIAQLAIAFGVDFQEFAPLPTGNIGTGQQSEILHMKTRGKGPAVIMELFEHIINTNGILPRTVKFGFKIQDLSAEISQAQARLDRGKDRAFRIQSGELDLEAARELAVMAGDLPQHIAEAMDRRKRENPPKEPEENPMSPDQIRSGMQSTMKKADLDRMALLTQLYRGEELDLGEGPEITDEDIEQQRQKL